MNLLSLIEANSTAGFFGRLMAATHVLVVRSPNPAQTIQTRTAPAWDPDNKLFTFWVLGIDTPLWQSKDGLHWAPGPKPNMRVDMAVYDSLDSDPLRRFKAPLINDGFATFFAIAVQNFAATDSLVPYPNSLSILFYAFFFLLSPTFSYIVSPWVFGELLLVHLIASQK